MSSKKIIPKSFELGGHTINIEYKNDLIFNNEASGQAKYMSCLIELQEMGKAEGIRITKSYQEQTFIHELCHMILFQMSNPLATDEAFVDNFSQYLYQFLKSAKYK